MDGRARRDPRRDRHERRRSLRHRARGVRGPACSATPRSAVPSWARVELDQLDHRGSRSPSTTRSRYTPPSLVVAAAGSMQHEAVVAGVREAFGAALEPRRRRPAAAPAGLRGRARRRGHAACSWCRGASSRPTWCSDARDWPGTTTAGSRSACSTRRSAAACRPGCSRRSGRSAGWPTRCTASLAARRHRHVGCVRGLPARQGRRGARPSASERDRQGGRRRADRRRAGARQGPAARVDRARPGGPVVADEPGSARPSWSTRGWSRWTRSWPRSRRSPTTTCARVAADDPGPAQGARGGRPVRRRRQLRGGAVTDACRPWTRPRRRQHDQGRGARAPRAAWARRYAQAVAGRRT